MCIYNILLSCRRQLLKTIGSTNIDVTHRGTASVQLKTETVENVEIVETFETLSDINKCNISAQITQCCDTEHEVRTDDVNTLNNANCDDNETFVIERTGILYDHNI